MAAGETMKLHLCAPAGSCRRFFETLHLSGAQAFVDRLRNWLGNTFTVTGDLGLLDAEEDDRRGGRSDDDARADDLGRAFADDRTCAIVTLRGGAWLTRVLPQIDFSPLDRRSTPLTVFGFSEITSLVNLVACHPFGRGILDLGPAFIRYGLKRFDARFVKDGEPDPATIEAETRRYFTDLGRILSGHGSSRRLPIRVHQGRPESGMRMRFVGGNLAVFAALLASRDFQARLFAQPTDRERTLVRDAALWLVLEDVNEAPYRIDRLLAHLTLSGVWSRVQGLLLGNFHQDADDLLDAVLALLPRHLGRDHQLPILICERIGHVWPMSPLPLNWPVRLHVDRNKEGELRVDWPELVS